MRKNQNLQFSILLFCFVVIFDQATKWSVLAFLSPGEVVRICESVNLVLVLNPGTSFGLLSPHTGAEHILIIILTILCIVLVGYVFFKMKTRIEQVLCALILGGATGNLIDRFAHGAVIDFIDLYYGRWHWPAFNVSDSFISVSAVILVLYNLMAGGGGKRSSC
ncbi:MAG: signal peptidase II [Holosporales bacterium]|jgi:signal peptidase II|nr:signal peptidase II [Holosporales bacterium]